MRTVSNIKIGACSVTYGGTELGHTKGGVTVSYAPSFADITADEYGETPVDKALTGEEISVAVPLAESTIANLLEAIPASTSANGGGAATMGKTAGHLLSTDAKELVLHPLRNEASDDSEDVVLYKAVATDTVEVNYEVDNEQVVEVTFTGLIDSARSDGALIGHFGSIS